MRFYLVILFFIGSFSYGQEQLPLRGLAIAAPSPEHVDRFVDFIDAELSPMGINTLILRVDYNFQYTSHPELVDEHPLSQDHVDKLVEICAKHNITIVPQINLLGHQSWAEEIGKLLEVYPQFDETPAVKMPEQYQWPNDDGLYCKSYCPQHPDLHKIVFALVDEVMEAFKADAFHAGMDEVFYIGEDNCPRCSGMDKAELYAAEVTKIRNHLASNGKRLWIWGDRLIDGKLTGLGMWEASMNSTHKAIDLIPKDVFICDWHYERADPTAVYFAIKGFDVASCSWRNPQVAIKQKELLNSFRSSATDAMKSRYQGMIQTVWGSPQSFMDLWAQKDLEAPNEANTMKALFN
ncbi:glycoside hydrolase [Galbibacter marinus]|uniref:Glycoside hydrolase n=1 Tax=Galbibacter marinus TaxID=555500 RepID=K2P3S6_9FLAO|nr:family 20 glycosylhydrolase [Galbibacter marinus]EKF55698.1 glycoside hydrolase [Galbibacter marinus]